MQQSPGRHGGSDLFDASSAEPREPEFAASSGELPLPQADVPEQAQPGGSEAPTVRRTRVSLTAPAPTPRSVPEPADHDEDDEDDEDDEARIYLAPPLDGLSKFDLGSVPASVTPPPTWRKAAWFASLASGGVVVSLLVAGTMLVGQPAADNRQAIDGWTDRPGGAAPLLPGEYYAEATPTGEPDSSTNGDPTRQPASGRQSSSDRLSSDRQPGLPAPGSPSGSESSPVTTGPTGSSGPTTTPVPEKPPVTPAPRSTEQRRYIEPHDPEEMGDVSQTFLDTVTEDPQAAYAMTGGEQKHEGVAELRRDYADVAYFVVEHIHINQNEGYTVNTVEVTRKDGSTTEEVRKLYFGNNEKVEGDGR